MSSESHATDTRFAQSSLICHILGVPIYMSHYTMSFIVFHFFTAFDLPHFPRWFGPVFILSFELILQLTILIHEFGHGLMSVYVGGRIESILLWPFGGICFSSLPKLLPRATKISNDIKVVVAGPLTHVLLQGPLWGCLVHFLYPDANLWKIINPLSRWEVPFSAFSSDLKLLGFLVSASGLSLNVMLFIFNAFFPMYPMDAAQLLVSLLLKFGYDIYGAAERLIIVSGVCVVFFVNHSLSQLNTSDFDLRGSLSLFLAIRCAWETLQVYNLAKNRKLHEHPLFDVDDEPAPGNNPLIPLSERV